MPLNAMRILELICSRQPRTLERTVENTVLFYSYAAPYRLLRPKITVVVVGRVELFDPTSSLFMSGFAEPAPI